MKHFGWKVLLSLVSTALFFALAEGAARFGYTPARTVYPGIFEYDGDKVYALRKNLTNGAFAGARVMTNSYGQRDREIPADKPARGFRVLAVGDSVTFGHGVRAEDSWPEILERRLAARLPDRQVDVVNTAVPGNSPFQEYYDLRRGLALEPDAVIIQFVLNDLIEPYKVYRRYGGRGKDYHGVEDVPWWDHELSERSAFYLLLKDLATRARFGVVTRAGMQEKALRQEAELSWNAGADAPTDPRVEEAWRECLAWMQREVDLCRDRGLAVVLLVTPVKFQFLDPSRTYAQQRLAEFARQNAITFVDVLPLLEQRAVQEIISRHAADAELPGSTIAARYPQEWSSVWKRHFLDYDHFNPVGHEFVVDALFAPIEQVAARR